MNSSLKSTVTAKSVMDKLQALTSKITEKASEGSEKLSTPVISETPNFSNITENGTNTLVNIIRYTLIILVIGFILLNILAALELLPQSLSEFFKSILLFFGYKIPRKSKENTSETIPDVTSINNIKQDEIYNPNTAITVLESAAKNLSTLYVPEPDEAGSNTQSQNQRKSGYCYIGEDRGFRSCIKVGINDKCMSGNIFPTKAICINPKLRQ